MTALNLWFRKRVSLAVGIVASGVALGGLMVPIVTQLIDTFQWRQAMLIIAVGMLVVGIPLSLVVRHKPEQYGYQPDGDVIPSAAAMKGNLSTVPVEVNFTVGQALKTRNFWFIAVGSACTSFVVSSVITHIMPYLSSLGIDRTLSSYAALAIPVTSLSGRLGSVWFGDKFGSKQMFMVGFIALGAGLLLLANISATRLWLLIPCIAALGFGWGNNVIIRVMLQREHFGTTSLGKIFGFTEGIQMMGQMTGPPIAGWVFDQWGGYQGAWLGFCIIIVIGIFLALGIPKLSGDRSLLNTE